MPTPAVNGEASIIHFTAGTRQPYSIEAPAIRASRARRRPPHRREADVVHQDERQHEHHHEDGRAQHERHTEARHLGDVAAGDRARQHRRAP